MRRAPTLAVTCGMIFLVGCSSSGPAKSSKTTRAAAPFTVHGTVLLDDLTSARTAAINGANKTTTGCVGLGSYSEVKPGGNVDIADDGGATLALAPLVGGYVANDAGTVCRFTFSASVASGPEFYTVTVGHQPNQKVTAATMHAGVTITVGSG